ncbi:MAG TPA: MFS transporter [Hyphomicrobiaceae bacterium]|nr:MFS transporter [Hyphomicrobiaceae bacterium]
MVTLFRSRSFRLQWPADLLTSCAFEMETLILGWYVLTETGSVLLLTLFGALQYLGTLASPMFGVVGDRTSHRNLLCGMRAIYCALAGTLMALAFAGTLTPALVCIIATAMGLVRPSDLGVRQALIADYVPAHELTAAMAISRTTSDFARVGGALAGAGMFAAFGIGPAYIAVVACYAIGLLLTIGIPASIAPKCTADANVTLLPRPSAWRDLKEGLAYVWSMPQVLAAMLVAFLANLTAYPLTNGLLPYVAKSIYRIDQSGLGYLVASFAAGALAGSVFITMFGRKFRPARTMIVSTAAWYAILLAFAHVEDAALGMLVLMLAGFAQSICMITLIVVVLRATSDRLRGRVMGVRMLVIYSLPLGLLAAGALIDLIGFAQTAMLYATLGLLLTLAIALRWHAALWPVQTPANAR